MHIIKQNIKNASPAQARGGKRGDQSPGRELDLPADQLQLFASAFTRLFFGGFRTLATGGTVFVTAAIGLSQLLRRARFRHGQEPPVGVLQPCGLIKYFYTPKLLVSQMLGCSQLHLNLVYLAGVFKIRKKCL